MKHTCKLLVAVALFGAAAPLEAQTPPGAVIEGRASFIERAILEGVVVDSISGGPIEGVLIRMDTGQETFSDVRGEFRLVDLTPGRRLFAILTSDCRITWAAIDVIAGVPRRVRLRLPQAFGAAAEEAQREREARQRGSGRRLERGEIDALGAKSVIELIRRLAPGMVSGLPTQVGATATLGSGRSRSFVEEDPPVVVIDGVRMPSSEGILEQMQPSEVELLEVLPGAAAGWEYGSAGAAGVIKISRRRGIATGAVEQMEAAPCVVPEFPRGH